MLTAASHWLPISVASRASLPLKFSTGPWWEKKQWSHPCCGQPLFPTLFLPFQGWPRWPDRRKIHPLGSLLWCCDATSLPARQLDWGHPQAKLYEPYRYHPPPSSAPVPPTLLFKRPRPHSHPPISRPSPSASPSQVASALTLHGSVPDC